MAVKCRLLVIALLAMSVVVIPAAPAAAENCRAVARDVHRAVQAQLREGDDDPRRAATKFQRASVDHPDCTSELTELAEWYDSQGAQPFPFSSKDDPAKAFLGPIGWWWNTVYVTWFGRSTLLMVLFGWEIFLTGIFVPLSIAWALIVSLIGSVRGRTA